MNIANLNKKELKNYINENGFFFHMQCNTLEKDSINALLSDKSINMINTGVTIPEGEDVIVYRGIASQNYGVGEKSRNGYKYDQNGWDMTDYFINPLVLFQHDHSQPIGKATSFWLDNSNNLNIMFFVYKDALEGTDKVRVEKGLITAISTGAMTDEYMFEEVETGNLITEEQAEEKYGWGNIWDAYFGQSDFLILVITKATMVENSLVTIGSNEKAMAVQNGIGQFFENKADILKQKLGDKINERKNPKESIVESNDSEESTLYVVSETEDTQENEETQENVEISEEINIIDEAEENKKKDTSTGDDDCEPTEPEEKEPLEGSDEEGCGKKKKNEEDPEMKNSLNISENQDEKPEITENVEQTEEVIEKEPAENAEKTHKSEHTIKINVDSDDIKKELDKISQELINSLNKQFSLKTNELETQLNSKIEEQEKTLEDAISLIDKVLDFVESEHANNKVLMDNLKKNVIDGVPLINSKKLSNNPLAGRINGLEKIMGLDN